MRNMLATVAQMMQCYSNSLMQQKPKTPKKASMSLNNLNNNGCADYEWLL